LPDHLEFSFAETLPGTVWKTLADPSHNRLFVEVRDRESKRVTFSLFDMGRAQWVWKEKNFDEPWWISLAGISFNILLLTIYTDTQNPDKKSIIAFDVDAQKIAWWKNDFSFDAVIDKKVKGGTSKFGHKEVVLDIFTGEEMPENSFLLPAGQNFQVIRPFQYQEGSTHFDTVKAFLERKCNFSPVFSVEYCEHQTLILISAFAGKQDLANNLFVFNSEGEIVLKETLGEHLKGIASDTFFIFSGYLVFVKNKCELISYKLL
jgi:hypothetical protein